MTELTLSERWPEAQAAFVIADHRSRTLREELMATLKELHPITGRCACGAVTYACSIEAEVALCSCDTCRRSSGSAFQAWVNGARSSLSTCGSTASWASSDHATRHYCVACGTTVLLFERDEPEVVEVAAGTIDGPDGIVSTRISRTYEAKRPPWGRMGDDAA